jgi:hypothetical protein
VVLHQLHCQLCVPANYCSIYLLANACAVRGPTLLLPRPASICALLTSTLIPVSVRKSERLSLSAFGLPSALRCEARCTRVLMQREGTEGTQAWQSSLAVRMVKVPQSVFVCVSNQIVPHYGVQVRSVDTLLSNLGAQHSSLLL